MTQRRTSTSPYPESVSRKLTWAYFGMLFGMAIVVVSVIMDVTGGSDWWHAGTIAGTAFFTWGLLTGLWDRRGPQRADEE